ncbi:hypothetical protein ABW20_dc0104923 [Dactylellina cionopaga]|nr:hypothetical protein ABW20_dc0104923 [Dactylellina cionopaga]
MADPEDTQEETPAEPPALLPVFSTDDLEIDPSAIEPMGHGGHSLVFKVSAKGFPAPSVLKIKSSYTNLQLPPPHVTTYTPALHAIVTISPTFEPHLRTHFNPYLHRKRRRVQLKLTLEETEAQLPLKGVLIEYIPGIRLSAFRSIPPAISQKIMDGIRHIHSKGILHRDAKKRNIIIVPNSDVLDGSEKVVWIDFSNSLVVEDFRGEPAGRDELFRRAIEAEVVEVEKIISKLER